MGSVPRYRSTSSETVQSAPESEKLYKIKDLQKIKRRTPTERKNRPPVALNADKIQPRPFREYGRRALLRALADEYACGDSLSKLYVSQLARHIADLEPRLLKKPTDPRVRMSAAEYNMQKCGVLKYEPGSHQEIVKSWPQLKPEESRS